MMLGERPSVKRVHFSKEIIYHDNGATCDPYKLLFLIIYLSDVLLIAMINEDTDALTSPTGAAMRKSSKLGQLVRGNLRSGLIMTPSLVLHAAVVIC